MVKLFSPERWHGRRAASLPVLLALALAIALLEPGRVLAQPLARPSPRPKRMPAPRGQAKAKGEADAATDNGGTQQTKDEKKTDDQPPAEPPPDPSQTQKVAPVEVFKDPNAEEILDVKKFNPIRNRPPAPGDVAAVQGMASTPNASVDSTVIRRVVEGMVAQLTDTKNIQAVIDPPPGMPAGAPAMRAIEEATTTSDRAAVRGSGQSEHAVSDRV